MTESFSRAVVTRLFIELPWLYRVTANAFERSSFLKCFYNMAEKI